MQTNQLMWTVSVRGVDVDGCDKNGSTKEKRNSQAVSQSHSESEIWIIFMVNSTRIPVI